MIYLDYASGEKVNSSVLEVYTKSLKEDFANPNSVHYLGKKLNTKIEESTSKILNILGLDDTYEIVYTSGATESNNLAIKGLANRYKNFGKTIIISSLEHTSITASCEALTKEGFNILVCPVTKKGLINIEELKKMLNNDVILVSITSLDSELSLKQDIDSIKEVLNNYENIHFHTDASSIIGKEQFNFNGIDLITIAPHKFGGIGDLGMLIKKKNVFLNSIISGGRSTTVYRAGTPNCPSIIANTKALELAINNQKDNYEYVKKLNNKIKEFLEKYPNIVINTRRESSPYIINFGIKNVLSNTLVDYLSEKEIYVSSKTSCCPVYSPSKLVLALTNNKNIANESVRVSLSRNVKEEEIDIFLKELKCFLERVD